VRVDAVADGAGGHFAEVEEDLVRVVPVAQTFDHAGELFQLLRQRGLSFPFHFQ
jgi:hypothetical protein